MAELVAERGLRCGASWRAQLFMLTLLITLGGLLASVVGDLMSWATHRVTLLLALAGIGAWRWSWFLLQNARAILYRYLVFPRLRRQAEAAMKVSGPITEVTIMATTYREKPWLTKLVFGSIFSELRSLEGLTRAPRVVVATGCDEDDAKIQSIYALACESSRSAPAACWPPELILLRADNGKRPAIAAALREIARGEPKADGVVVFLDGDSMMQPGFLRKILPLFRLSPCVSAITTNENGFVQGPSWFAEWISLRFGLRHRTMCSVSLSGKLLCLTGRLSAFRASVARDPTFLAQIERDAIQHWLWGSFDMLSGDDKSTWYWLSQHQCRMLYVPDALVTTVEVVQTGALRRAFANIRRWSGNSLRHSWRAIRLGPRKLGWFPWWSLLDQRVAMFTVLFGPLVCLTAISTGRPELAAGFGLWLLLSRLAHSTIAGRHGRRWSAFYIPLVLLSDWAVALTKLWVLFHPAKQSWLNRGARTMDSTRRSDHYRWQAGLAHYLYVFTCFIAVLGVCLIAGFLPLLPQARLFLRSGTDGPPAVPPVPAREAPERIMFGSLPDQAIQPYWPAPPVTTFQEPSGEVFGAMAKPLSPAGNL